MKISFCDDCGDVFTCSDLLERHRKNAPAECLSVTPEEADAKRRDTQKAHDECKARLEEFLRAGEDIGMPFPQIIEEKYPDSSKKRTGGQQGAESVQRTLINADTTYYFHAYHLPSLFLFC